MYRLDMLKNNFASLLKIIKDRNPIIVKLSPHIIFQKWMILLILSFILTILLTPQIRFQHFEYKAGDIATVNIKADSDFFVEKKIATEQKRMEASNEISSVYDYDSYMAAKILTSLNNAFSMMKEVNSGKASSPAKETKEALASIKKYFESPLGITLSAEEFQILYKSKFSPSLSAKAANLITSAYMNSMITNVTFLQQEKDRGITIRDLINQTEIEQPNLSRIRHITDIESAMTKMDENGSSPVRSDIDKVALALAIKLIRPNLVYNKDATEIRKREASKDVKPVLYKIQKNEMLVREGEKITPAELDKLDAYYRLKGDNRLSRFLIFTGMFFIIAFLGVILYYHAETLHKNTTLDMIFVGIVILFQIIVVRVGIFIAAAGAEAFPALPAEAFIYPIPFSAAAMLVSLLLNRNLALLLSIFLSVMVAFLFEGKISLFIFSFIGSVVASYGIVNCRERNAFFKVSLLLGIINLAAILFLNLIYENTFNSKTLITLLMGFIGGIVSGILVAGLAPLFESLFHYTTDIKLLELANLNQPIFQRMIMEAPGTYHHSIMVASMVEAAAENIGANSLLAKVSAYYHDIGKLKKPQYFIENQLNGDNKHDKLSPKMSSLVIISHIKDGYELALKSKLSKEIANIIKEHHGTSLVSYFYEKAKKDKDPSIRALPETDFRYPGPKPQTKEAGLVLLGDVLEASSRTLSNPTPSRIRTLVRERIEGVFNDGQLDECELTLHDLNKIAESFTMFLNGIFHHRIDYPELAIPELNWTRKETSNGVTDRKSAEKNKSIPAAAASSGE